MMSFLAGNSKTDNNNSDAPRRYCRVVQAAASATFSFSPGQILALAPDARQWPEPLRGWLSRSGSDDPIVVELPAPPAWFLAWLPTKLTVIDPATWRTVEPPPPPRPELWTRAQILAKLKMTAGQFEEAQLLGFPRPTIGTPSAVSDGTRVEPQWRADRVTEWSARQQAVTRG